MLNSEQIIEGIRDDAPCVYDILHEQLYEPIRSSYPQSWTDYTWEDYFKIFSDQTPPTADQLLEALSEYSGDNWDVHHWSGRYTQMIETANAIESMISVFDENKKKLAPMMDYEYTIKIDLLKNLQELII